MNRMDSNPADRMEAANALVRGVPEEDEEEEDDGEHDEEGEEEGDEGMDIRNETIHTLEFVASHVSA
jgi:hypothetical protein